MEEGVTKSNAKTGTLKFVYFGQKAEVVASEEFLVISSMILLAKKDVPVITRDDETQDE